MKRKITIFLVAAIIFAAGIWTGRGVFYNRLAKNYGFYPTLESTYQQRLGQSVFPLINPLIACEVPNQNVFTKLQPLRERLGQLVDGKNKENTAEQISIYYRDLISGQWLGIAEDEKYIPASLVKVPLLLAYYKYAEYNPEILNKKLTYSSSVDADASQELIKPPTPLERGKEYSVSELLSRMIVYSGNNSHILLDQALDPELQKRVYSDLQIKFPELYGTGTESSFTAKSFATFFRILYNATYLNQEMSEKALELLSQTIFTEGLAAGVPEKITVAHKFGERTVHVNETGEVLYRELHDCGIVYHPKRPYMLCVMTKGKDFTALKQTIREISSQIYDAVQKL
jgi:beta-lactamase class A